MSFGVRGGPALGGPGASPVFQCRTGGCRIPGVATGTGSSTAMPNIRGRAGRWQLVRRTPTMSTGFPGGGLRRAFVNPGTPVSLASISSLSRSLGAGINTAKRPCAATRPQGEAEAWPYCSNRARFPAPVRRCTHRHSGRLRSGHIAVPGIAPPLPEDPNRSGLLRARGRSGSVNQGRPDRIRPADVAGAAQPTRG